jgi:hypothetical protein
MGTKVSTENDFSAAVDVNVNLAFNVPGVSKLGAGVSGGWQTSSNNSQSQTITKTSSNTISLQGGSDGVDHTQDQIILLLNPAVAVEQTQQVANNQCGATTINWYTGLSGSAGTMNVYTVYVEWLVNPSSMPTDVAEQLRILGFTSSDFQTILSVDPFWNGATVIDPTRFVPTAYTFPYEPPLQQSDCNDGVCSCLSLSEKLTNELNTEVTNISSTTYSVGITEDIPDLSIGIFSLDISSNQKFTWVSSSTNDDTTSNTQMASVTISCPSTTYQGPTNMAVYWDTLFGSFLFVPTILDRGALSFYQGTLTDTSGHALRREPVMLSVGGKTFRTWTDNRGEFTFARAVGLPALHLPSRGKLSIRGRTYIADLRPARKFRISVH